jgi:sugar O-acyltransferase (sialic acid O-acetyltransferase NeuD family)
VSHPPLMSGRSPVECDRIIIVGAGGFGREVLQWARHAWPQHASKIAGFLSSDPSKLSSHAPTLPILGSPDDFEPQPNDGLLLAIGIPGARRIVAEQLEAHGARFLSLIHPTAIIADSALIGTGTVICPYAIVSDAVLLGRFVLVNYHASLGHDARADDFSVLSPYAALGGAASLGSEAFLGLHSSVGPGRVVGAKSKVSANSCALVSAPDLSLVYGVPGRVSCRIGEAIEREASC